MSRPLFHENSQSLIRKHLTPDLYAKLKSKATRTGFTLDDAIRSGIENPDSSIGIYAGDAQCYELFNEIFTPLIREYHHRDTHIVEPSRQPLSLEDPDPEGRFILSTRIRIARNLKDHPFPCHMRIKDRKAVEEKIKTAVLKFPPPLSGTYISYETADKTLLSQLFEEKLCFKRGDRFQESAGLNSDFPAGRGIFYSRDKNFLIWVQEEDHMRIISMERSSRLDLVFERLCVGLDALSQDLSFANSPTLGYLTSCPTNIGTTMRAGVHIRLEKLDQKKDLLKKITQKFDLQIRGTAGEKTQVSQAVFDISNRRRLGITGPEIVKNLALGLREIIRVEKSL